MMEVQGCQDDQVPPEVQGSRVHRAYLVSEETQVNREGPVHKDHRAVKVKGVNRAQLYLEGVFQGGKESQASREYRVLRVGQATMGPKVPLECRGHLVRMVVQVYQEHQDSPSRETRAAQERGDLQESAAGWL